MFGIREKFHPPSIVETLKGNRKLRIGNHDVEIVETPGHTQAGIPVAVFDSFPEALKKGESSIRNSLSRSRVYFS